MRHVAHTITALAAAVSLALVMPASSFAAPPFSGPVEIAIITMEPSGDSFTSITPTVIGGEAAPVAFWGATTAVKYTGASSLWCAGAAVPSGASRSYGLYPSTTRGEAVKVLPELADYYSSRVSFYYLMPSLGGADKDAFRVMWAAAGPDGARTGPTSSAGSFKTTASWKKSSTIALSSPRESANLSRKPGRLTFSFLDRVETFQTPRSGLGASIDDILITGFTFGPVRDVRAEFRQGQGVALSWKRPSRSTAESVDETRTLSYRVWRSLAGRDSWTEITGAGRLSATAILDSGAQAGVSYDYAIQAWGPGDSTARGEQAMHSFPERPQLTLAAPATVKYASAALSGVLQDIRGDAFPAGTPVVLQSSRDNKTYRTIGTALTRADGSFSFTARPTARTYFRARYTGRGNVGTATSAARKVVPPVSLSTPSVPSRTVSTAAFTVSGTLKPRHTAKTYPVRVYRELLTQGGVWRSYAPVLARASNSGAYSKYSARLKLAKGTWRLRAYHPADSQNAATWSGYRYVTVK